MDYDCDIAIAGGGHNGLACAAALARAGLRVVVAERSEHVGGATATREVTLPGFRHDLYGSSHVWIHANAQFKALEPELRAHGLEYIWADDAITGHPGSDGHPGIVVYRDVDRTCESIARHSRADARRYREIFDGFVEIKEGFVKAMFSPPSPPSYLPAAMERSTRGLRMLRDYQLSARAFVGENFENPQVQAFILGWALAPQVTPDQEAIGQSFYIMIPGIHVYGQAIPKGGSDGLARSLASYVRAHGGTVLTGTAVTRIIVGDGVARGFELADGSKITAGKGVVSSLDPHQTFLRLLDPALLPEDFLRLVRSYSFGNIGVFRGHYALNQAPAFREGTEMSRTSFQRIFGSVEQTEQHYADIASGVLPRDPFIWSACWTVLDPSRAPAGKHTLILDTFVPGKLRDGSWEQVKHAFAATLLQKFRRYTENMDDGNILGEYIDTPETIERANPCLVNGATTGGERTIAQSGFFRPVPGYSQYRSPLRSLYMTGASCHPGGGITAMGMTTAQQIIGDITAAPRTRR
jgi:phytoene dehydrogenase-like protein